MRNETSSTISLRNFLPISKKLRERNGSVRGDKKYESTTTQTEADSAQGVMCASRFADVSRRQDEEFRPFGESDGGAPGDTLDL